MNRLLLIFLFFSNTLFAQVNLNLGLRAYYPFSGNANDVSGNNNNPVFNNAVLTTDHSGNPNSAYHFNGTSSYMKIPDHPSLKMTNKMSLAAWVRPTGYYTGTCYQNIMVMKADVNNLPTNYFLNFGDVYTGCSTPTTATERFTGNGVVAPTPLVQLNRWYSVVWTSDGINERLYVDCELKATSPVSGAAYSNTKDLFFGHQDDVTFPYWLNGDLDEIRIYDRELNADEVKAYGGCVTLTSGANIGGIINTYTPVLALNSCNAITVEDASTFNTGDTVLLIQMKGAITDSTNSSAFGTVTDYRQAGNYEINYVKSKSGNVIVLKNLLTRSYNIPDGKVQLVRVPYYQNATVSSTLTCLPWDGSKGGILVVNVSDTINLDADMDVSGKGFLGGKDPFTVQPTFDCFQNQFFYSPNPDLASEKGEGIATLSAAKSFGKGSSANGGGGGNSHNSGGGGGSNSGAGGLGGYNFEADVCSVTVPFDNRGLGGKSLPYSASTNKIFMGGGGGAGHSNNPQAFQSEGGNGAGIIIVIANKIITGGNRIMANGNPGVTCGNTGAACHEGMGGGGAGGTVLLKINDYIDNTAIEIKGGKGADMTAANFGRVGPGGGGGGGIAWVSNTALPGNISLTNTGGARGVCTSYSNDAWGTTAGANGSNLVNLQIPIDNIPYKPNIDSVRIMETPLSCDNFDFNGAGYTNTSPVTSWQWYFGDGGTDNIQNTNHSYLPGSYTVKLVVTDINGCKDSTTKNVTPVDLAVDAGPMDTICLGNAAVLQASSSVASQYLWAPAVSLNDPTILTPLASPVTTTTFYLTAIHPSGCSKKDSVLITVRSPNGFSINPPVDVCPNQATQLQASGGDLYTWQPAANLDNPTIFNPIATPSITTPYTVIINDTLCGYNATLSTIVTALPLPNIQANRANDIDCAIPQTYLIASGGTQYSWSPAATLNNPTSSSPLATPLITTQYVVTGTNTAGCVNYDSVTVNVSKTNKTGYAMPTGFTPNNDGLNDCYGIKYWGTITELEFSIYNRWGERIFYTTKPGDCWDGRYKGITQDPAVFVYMIKAKTTCEPLLFRKGTFVLIR